LVYCHVQLGYVIVGMFYHMGVYIRVPILLVVGVLFHFFVFALVLIAYRCDFILTVIDSC